jgi:hypothetical protein
LLFSENFAIIATNSYITIPLHVIWFLHAVTHVAEPVLLFRLCNFLN